MMYEYEGMQNGGEIEIENESKQITKELQKIEETIIIRDSCDVEVLVKDKQFALSLQAALQAIIVAILYEYVGNYEKTREISQELFQLAIQKQITKQRFIVSHSKNVKIKSFDEQVEVNIQILVQLLVALLNKRGNGLGPTRV